MPILKAHDLRELTDEELKAQLEERSKFLHDTKFQMITGSVDDVRSIRNARRDIARVKTVLREREIAAQKKAE